MGLEIHADAGEDPALLGSSAQYMRLQPIAVLGVSPHHGVELFVGAGVGAATIWSSPESPQALLALGASTRPTGALVVGSRFEPDAAPPVLVQLRADGVSQHGATARLTMTLELAP